MKFVKIWQKQASMASFGAVAGVAMMLAIACSAIRGKGHSGSISHTARQQN